MDFFVNKTLLIPALITAIFAAPSFANNDIESTIDSAKHWTVGGGVQTLTVTSDSRDFEFSGNVLTAQYAVTDKWAVKATYQSLEFDDNSDVSSTNVDVLAYFGRGFLTDNKLKVYAGLGFFSDTWGTDDDADDIDFSGFTVGGGVGYNWERVALDFVINARQASDYGEFVEDAGGFGTVVAVTGALTISARF